MMTSGATKPNLLYKTTETNRVFIKAHSHRAKAKLITDVSHLFIDLFCCFLLIFFAFVPTWRE